jgi:hypothetical protein
MSDQDELDRLNAELEAVWRATNSPRVTGRQLSRLYARAADLREQIDALEAAGEARLTLAWLEGEVT